MDDKSAKTASHTAEPAEDAEFVVLADSLPMMIWRAGPTGARDRFNQPWLAFAGRPRERELAFGWTERIHPQDHARWQASFQEAVAAQRDFNISYRLLRQDGAWRWVQDRSRPYLRDGTFAGFHGCCSDITDMQQAAEEREVLMQELQHRVRNNAQATASFLGLQASRSAAPMVADALRGAAARVLLASQVQDRMFRHTGSAAVLLAPELAAAARAAFELAERPELRLELTLAEPLAVPVRQAAPIALIVNELVTNALRHGFPAGHPGVVKVSLRHDEGPEAEVRVEDDGIGLPMLPASPAAPGGLGLHLTERLARQARGRLDFLPGKGTSARLRFTIAA